MRAKTLLIFIFIFCSSFSRPTTFDEREICEKNNGVWREFGNDCVDSCEAKINEFAICTKSIISSCQCAELYCWNQEKKECQKTSEFSKIYQAKIAQEKAKKDAEVKENQLVNKIENNQEIIVKKPEQQITNQQNQASPQDQPSQPPQAQPNNNQNEILTSPNPENQDQKIEKPQENSVAEAPKQEPQASVPPMFLEQEKNKKEKEQKENQPKKSEPIYKAPEIIQGVPGLPVVPLPK